MSEKFVVNDKAITVSLIAAVAENRVIGKNNKLLWHLPEDFKHFKNTTMGKPMIMGRKTFDSLPGGMLPGRPHIVITRNPPSDGVPPQGLTYVKSFDDALDIAYKMVRGTQGNEICVIGGAQIYEEALKSRSIHKIYLTRVHRDYVGDTYFPSFDMKDWVVTKESAFSGEPNFTIQTLMRA